MAVGNSLAKKAQVQQSSLTVYLAKDAVRNQINSVVGGKERSAFYFQYRFRSAGESGTAGMYEPQYRVGGTPGRILKSFTEPAAWSVLYGSI